MTMMVASGDASLKSGGVANRARDGVFLASTFGLLDTVAPLAYLLFGAATGAQAVAIFLKACMVLLGSQTLRPSRFLLVTMAVLVLLTLTGLIADFYHGEPQVALVSRYVAFTLSLFLTLSILNPTNLLIYLRFCTIIPIAIALVHIAMAATGSSTYAGGRYMYLRDLHPNLGGEIAAVAAFTACLSLRPLFAIPVLIIAFSDSILLSSRAAMGVIMLIAAIYAVQWVHRQNFAVLMAFYLLAPVLIILVALAKYDGILGFFGDMFLIDDQYRGGESHFVGRGELWSQAWENFRASPLIGQGLSLYDDVRDLGAHNAFLYGLAQNGALSLLFWAILLFSFYRCYIINKFYFFMSLSFLIMFMMNDRFFNLNSYPFILYVTLFSIASFRPTKRNVGTAT